MLWTSSWGRISYKPFSSPGVNMRVSWDPILICLFPTVTSRLVGFLEWLQTFTNQTVCWCWRKSILGKVTEVNVFHFYIARWWNTFCVFLSFLTTFKLLGEFYFPVDFWCLERWVWLRKHCRCSVLLNGFFWAEAWCETKLEWWAKFSTLWALELLWIWGRVLAFNVWNLSNVLPF